MTNFYPVPILSSLPDGQRGTLSEDAARAKMEGRCNVFPDRADAMSGIRERKSSQAVTHSFPAVPFPAGESAGGDVTILPASLPVALQASWLIREHPSLALEVHRQIERDNGYRGIRKTAPSGLTVRQKELLGFIRSRYDMDGIAPSHDEMCAAMGLASKSGINRIIVALEERGYIRRLPNRARAIVPIEV